MNLPAFLSSFRTGLEFNKRKLSFEKKKGKTKILAHRKQFYPPSMVVLVRVAFYATSIASLFFKLYSFLKTTLLILKICFSKKKHKTSPNHIRCVARLITNFGRKNQKKRESHKSSLKFQH